jgi:hypothetical protein
VVEIKRVLNFGLILKIKIIMKYEDNVKGKYKIVIVRKLRRNKMKF